MAVSSNDSALSAEEWAKLGAYNSPFSGTGVEFLPLGTHSEETEIVLHEVGYLARRPHWNYSRIFSPFWRLYYDLKPGHKVVFREKVVILGPDRLILIPDHQLFQTLGTEPRPKFWYSFSYACHLAPGQDIPIELPIRAEQISDFRPLVARKVHSRRNLGQSGFGISRGVCLRRLGVVCAWTLDTRVGKLG
jgi:hypothetical protein